MALSIDTAGILQKKRLVYIGVIFLLNLAGFSYYIYYLMKNGYLPSPFIYDKSDTFMDFFNVLYWAYDDGRYTEWGSVYPPLNFVFLRFIYFIITGAGFSDPALMRDNSQLMIIWGCLAYLLIPVIILRDRYWREFSNTEKIVLYLTIILSTPLLFALERGNLILIAPLLLSFAISRTGMARGVFIALLINIKPYFALLLLYYIIRKNWKDLIICVVCSGLVFLLCGLLLDNNTFLFFDNLFSFSRDPDLFSLREIMALPSSISALSHVLINPDGALFALRFLNPERINIIVNMIGLSKLCVIAIAVSALFSVSKSMEDSEILGLIVVLISNFSISVGGYTFILYIAIIPIILKMRYWRIYIALISLIAIPLDLFSVFEDSIGPQFSYLAGDQVEVFWTLGLGSIVRPVLNLILLLIFSYDFLSKNDYFAKLLSSLFHLFNSEDLSHR